METSYEQDQKDGTEPICSDSGALSGIAFAGIV